MATNNLLNQPTPNYRRFVDNQVLTDNQLNAVLDYLNHQDRLSRLLLHGVGIVCGLHISYAQSNHKIHLTKGVAVTTAGDLLKTEEKVFNGFKKFDDANVKYPFFNIGESDAIDLWELAEDNSPSDVNLLSQFKSKTDFRLQDAVAILYLEDYLDEEKDCSAVDCDTQGQPVINRLRVLLVSLENAEQIAEMDTVYSGFLQKESEIRKQTLVRHYTPRVLLNEANTRTYKDFKNEYQLSFETLAEKIEALSKISVFEKSLNRAGIDPADELLRISPQKFNFQYCYDLYKDITTAYNELRVFLEKGIGLCSPDPEAFPKHVLLGKPAENKQVLRHKFYPSPTHGKPMIHEIVASFERILLMIKNFKVEIKNDIKITPSKDDHYRLGERAVPFYYNLDNAENTANFLARWTENEDVFAPNYYEINYPDEKFDPLDVVLDGHDFYRIEGHVGKNIQDAHKQIQAIRDNKSLPFDVKPVAIGRYPEESLVDFDKYRIYFEDLQVVLEAWNEEQQCMVRSASTFLSGFSVKEPGKHTAYEPEVKRNDSVETTGTSGGKEYVEAVFQPVYTMPLYIMPTETHQSKTKRLKSKKFAKKRQFDKNFSKADESVGLRAIDTIKANDSKNDITIKILDVMPTATLNWQTDIREAAITIPAQLMGHLKEVEDFKLTDISEFSDVKLNSFLKALHDLSNKASSAINRLQHMVAKEQSEIKGKIWLDDYLHLLNRIVSSRCLIEKIKVLYETINERKSELFSGLILQSFIDKHPGAEHKAGVERGGTFILLYYSKNAKPTSQQQYTHAQIQAISAIKRKSELKLHHGLTEADKKEIEAALDRQRLYQPSDYEANLPDHIINADERFRVSPDEVQHGDVVGDLCLPYICCSDTPSVTFVFPDQLATLRLPVDHVCVDEDGNTNPLQMTVMPSGSTVKAFAGEKELSGVILENENGTFFQPNKVDREIYGKTIRFEVNGQVVEPTLHIVQQPRARFNISDDISFERNNSGAILLIKNTSVPFDELQFEWNINGHTVTNENATEFKYPLKVRPGQKLSVDINLIAFNDYCSDTQRETIEINVPGGGEPNDPNDPNQPVDKVDLILKDTGNQKIQVIKVVREITGSSLRIVKDLVDRAPVLIQKGITIQKANEYAQKLKEAGATVDIKK